MQRCTIQQNYTNATHETTEPSPFASNITHLPNASENTQQQSELGGLAIPAVRIANVCNDIPYNKTTLTQQTERPTAAYPIPFRNEMLHFYLGKNGENTYIYESNTSCEKIHSAISDRQNRKNEQGDFPIKLTNT